MSETKGQPICFNAMPLKQLIKGMVDELELVVEDFEQWLRKNHGEEMKFLPGTDFITPPTKDKRVISVEQVTQYHVVYEEIFRIYKNHGMKLANLDYLASALRNSQSGWLIWGMFINVNARYKIKSKEAYQLFFDNQDKGEVAPMYAVYIMYMSHLVTTMAEIVTPLLGQDKLHEYRYATASHNDLYGDVLIFEKI